MRHPVLEGVGPDRDPAQWGRYGSVIGKVLIVHHVELLVSSDSKEGCPNAHHGSVGDVGKSLDDQPITSHLGEPGVVAAI